MEGDDWKRRDVIITDGNQKITCTHSSTTLRVGDDVTLTNFIISTYRDVVFLDTGDDSVCEVIHILISYAIHKVCYNLSCVHRSIVGDRGFAKHEASEIHQTCIEMLSNTACQLNDMQGHPSIEACLSASFRERQLQQEMERLRNRNYIG